MTMFVDTRKVSKFLKTLRYDPATKQLTVTMKGVKNKRVEYVYFGVPEAVFRRMESMSLVDHITRQIKGTKSAESVSVYFTTKIKKYPAVKYDKGKNDVLVCQVVSPEVRSRATRAGRSKESATARPAQKAPLGLPSGKRGAPGHE